MSVKPTKELEEILNSWKKPKKVKKKKEKDEKERQRS